MAITYVGAGAINGNVASVTPALPAGLATGDLMIMLVQTGNEAVPSTPTGYTGQVPGSPQGDGTAATLDSNRLTAFYKFAGGSETAVATGDSGDHNHAQVIAFRGVDSTTPFHVHNEDVAPAAATAVAWPAVTTTVANCVILNLLAHNRKVNGSNEMGSPTNASLANLTKRTDTMSSTGAVGGGGFVVITGDLATAGASGGTTGTLVTTQRQARLTLALAPATVTSITGTAAITEAADTVSGAGALPIVGTAPITEGADTTASVGKLPIVGQAAVTEAADTISATGGATPIIGTAAITEAGDSVAAAGRVAIAGASALTETADTVSATGVLSIAGASAITEAADTVASAGKIAIAGAAALTEAADTLSAASTLATGRLALADILEAADTAGSASKLAIAAAGIAGEQGDTLGAASILRIVGGASMTEAGDGLLTALRHVLVFHEVIAGDPATTIFVSNPEPAAAGGGVVYAKSEGRAVTAIPHNSITL